MACDPTNPIGRVRCRSAVGERDGRQDGRQGGGLQCGAVPDATSERRVNVSRLLVVRHRQSTFNADRRFTGRADPSLSEQGERDAHLLADALAPYEFDAIVTSTLTRARQTAETIAGRTGHSVITDPRLVEHHVPAWQGLTREEIDALAPGAWQRWKDRAVIDSAGAEPWESVEARVSASLLDHGARWRCVLVVAHAGVLRALGTGPLGSAVKVGRSKGRWVHVEDGRLVDGGIERIL
jgi:glucosyl-3-phosphoglycerate phosphatase